MSCNVIVDNLIVGDYEVAKNLPLLQHLGVTHIVACGFDKGYFHSLRYVNVNVNVDISASVDLFSACVSYLKLLLTQQHSLTNKQTNKQTNTHTSISILL